MNRNTLGAVAAISGAVAVTLGALAAHALRDQLAEAGKLSSWKTAVLYHLTHSIFVLFLAQAGFRKTGWTVLLGILFFSGSIYLLCLLDGVSWLGPVTPLGGLLMIGGWVALAVSYLRKSE